MAALDKTRSNASNAARFDCDSKGEPSEDDAVTKTDARRQSAADVTSRRLEVARLHHEGVPVMQIVSRSGLSWGTVNSVIKSLGANGQPALERATRGRKTGDGRALNLAQEIQIRRFILMKRPYFYGLKDQLWTRDAVARLIKEKLNICLSIHGVGNYLNRWGIPPSELGKSPTERCTDAVQKWIRENEHIFKTHATERNARMLWLNKPLKMDGGLWCAQYVSADSTDSSDKSSEQIVPMPSLLSAVNARGTIYWRIITGEFNATKQIAFVKGLRTDAKRKLIIIRCDQSTYKSSDFKSWISMLKDDISIYPPLT